MSSEMMAKHGRIRTLDGKFWTSMAMERSRRAPDVMIGGRDENAWDTSFVTEIDQELGFLTWFVSDRYICVSIGGSRPPGADGKRGFEDLL